MSNLKTIYLRKQAIKAGSLATLAGFIGINLNPDMHGSAFMGKTGLLVLSFIILALLAQIAYKAFNSLEADSIVPDSHRAWKFFLMWSILGLIMAFSLFRFPFREFLETGTILSLRSIASGLFGLGCITCLLSLFFKTLNYLKNNFMSTTV